MGACEADPDAAFAVNARAAAAMVGTGVRVLQVSTDLVFDGRDAPTPRRRRRRRSAPTVARKPPPSRTVRDAGGLVVRVPLLFGRSFDGKRGATDMIPRRRRAAVAVHQRVSDAAARRGCGVGSGRAAVATGPRGRGAAGRSGAGVALAIGAALRERRGRLDGARRARRMHRPYATARRLDDVGSGVPAQLGCGVGRVLSGGGPAQPFTSSRSRRRGDPTAGGPRRSLHPVRTARRPCR